MLVAVVVRDNGEAGGVKLDVSPLLVKLFPVSFSVYGSQQLYSSSEEVWQIVGLPPEDGSFW